MTWRGVATSISVCRAVGDEGGSGTDLAGSSVSSNACRIRGVLVSLWVVPSWVMWGHMGGGYGMGYDLVED